MSTDYYLYQQEDIKYKNFTSILFFYQKYKDNPWNKGENFGDYLSKIIVGEIAISKGFKKAKSIENKLLGVGSILHFVRDENVTVKVIDDRNVEFEGEVTSLTQSSLILLNRDHGWNSSSVTGPRYWVFENETLSERRLRIVNEMNHES